MKAFSIEMNPKRAVHWLLAIAVLLYVVSGFGISEYRTVEGLTFGLLTKALSFRLHSLLFLPFIILLLLHVYFTLEGKRGRAPSGKKRHSRT